MKILHIEDFDCDGYGDFLTKTVAVRFVEGAFTHVESEGTIICCEIYKDGLVSIGEELCDIVDFDGCYVHYNKVIKAVCRAWSGENPGYGDDPLELITRLIDERDESAKEERKRIVAMRDALMNQLAAADVNASNLRLFLSRIEQKEGSDGI